MRRYSIDQHNSSRYRTAKSKLALLPLLPNSSNLRAMCGTGDGPRQAPAIFL
jgi:hypothetical protein